MQLRSNRYVLVMTCLLRLAMLATLFFGLSAGVLAFHAQAATAAPSPRLSWTEEDGTELPVDWRTSTAWVWNKSRFSLEVWIEAPKDMLQASRADIARHPDLQIESTGPFRLRSDHLFLVVQMRNPSRFVQLKSDPHDTHVRALRIEIPYAKTTWMRESACPAPTPYLTERFRRERGPFFVALRCTPEPAPGGSTKKQRPVTIQVQVSEDAVLALEPKGSATTSRGANALIVRPSTASVRSQQLLATLAIKDQQGLKLAEFDLRRQLEPPAPSLIFLPTDRILITSLGLSAMSLNADYHASESHDWTGTEAALTIDWALVKEDEDPVYLIEAQLPVAAFGNPFESTTAHFGWLRALRASAKESLKRPNRQLWGVQATYFNAPQANTGATIWASPALGFQTETSDRSAWTVWIAPFALGAGSDGWARLQVSVRRQIDLVRRESVGLAFIAEGIALRSFSRGDDGWSANGLNLGLRGVFQ